MTRRSLIVPAVALLVLASGLALPTASSAAQTTPSPGCLVQVAVDLALIVDTSGSMNDSGKLSAAKSAGHALLQQLGASDQSALVVFNTSVGLPRNLTTLHVGPSPSTDFFLQQQVAGGATALWKGVRMARFELTNQPHVDPSPYSGRARLSQPGVKQAIVLLSDGDQTIGGGDPVTEAAYAKADGIEIFSIALGTDLSATGRQTLTDVATDPAHYFEAPDPTTLTALFQRISGMIRDISAPRASIERPALPAQLYVRDAAAGPTPFAAPYDLPAVKGALRPFATASDDCALDHVSFRVDEVDDGGNLVAIRDLGWVETLSTRTMDDGSTKLVYAANESFACEGYVGPHVLTVTAVDWLGKTTSVTTRFLCVTERTTSEAVALDARGTNPADANVTTLGASVTDGVGGVASWLANASVANPIAAEVSALYEEAGGASPGGDINRTASSYARAGRAFVGPAALDERLVEARACAGLDTTRAPFQLRACGAATPTLTSVLAPGGCGSWTEAGRQLTSCTAASFVVTSGDVELDVTLGESVYANSSVATEVTVIGVHVVAQSATTRAELQLARAYAGASLVGARGLLGPYRVLDRERDAGAPGDAPDSIANAMPLAAGVYGGRLARADDQDAYRTTAIVGEKVHALVAPSSKATAWLHPLPGAPSALLSPTFVTVSLYDPDGMLRDEKSSLVSGAPTQVELNADKPGAWTVVIGGNASSLTDYTFTLSVTDPPMLHADDALALQDAGNDCLDGLFVGPGVHVGAIEDAKTDASDWYRFQLYEGEKVAIALRPGDTVDAASMTLHVFDQQCRELPLVARVTLVGGFKGGPSYALFDVPPGGDGIYRAEVAYESGVGTYELAILPSQTGLLWGVP